MGDAAESSSTPNTPDTEVPHAIDSLLERYLYLLDEQQKLQEALGKDFSAGFFSLARANHSCAPGRRYGEDYYDERMKATKRITITPPTVIPTEEKGAAQSHSKSARFTLITPDPTPAEKPELPNPQDSTSKDDNERENRASRSSTPSSSASQSKEEDEDTQPDKKPKPKPKPKAKPNPLSWFGILVPPPLRAAQQSFTSAVDETIPALVSVIAEMRDVEAQVEMLRGRLSTSLEGDGCEKKPNGI